MTQVQEKKDSRPASVRFIQRGLRGFTLVELLIVVLVGGILTAISIPIFQTAMADMQINSEVSAISGALSQTRYAAIMNSQVYTLVFTAPGNTYVVKNVSTGIANGAVPLPSNSVTINGGTNATYIFTLCPNGTVYGSGGICPGNTLPPGLTVTNLARELTINVSSVGNVSTTSIR